MGTDMDGGVEVRPRGGVWRLHPIEPWTLTEDYDVMGMLFGIRNYAGFSPIAHSRGLPDDISAELASELSSSAAHDPTSVTYQELANVDWSAAADSTDQRIYHYINVDGEYVLFAKSIEGLYWQSIAGKDAVPDGSKYPEGTEWRTADHLWRVQRMTRQDVLDQNQPLRHVLAQMKDLAETYGGDNVRLVVWFDS